MPAMKIYNRVNFQAYPDKTTPVSATNLNKMDKGLDDIDDEVVTVKDAITTINDKLTLKELASVTTASGKTFQNALLELKTTWDTLTDTEKLNTVLYYGNGILYPNSTAGIYSRVTLSTSSLIVTVLNISTGQSLLYNGGTITNKTDVALDANLSLKGF